MFVVIVFIEGRATIVVIVICPRFPLVFSICRKLCKPFTTVRLLGEFIVGIHVGADINLNVDIKAEIGFIRKVRHNR